MEKGVKNEHTLGKSNINKLLNFQRKSLMTS